MKSAGGGRGLGFRLLSAPERALLAADPVEVAPNLLGKVLVAGLGEGGRLAAGRIVEVEAYRSSDDPASHAFSGPTRRNEVMFRRPGSLYVYFTYGMHHCCNVVSHEEGEAGAILIRALEPLVGLDEMETRRRSRLRADARLAATALCSGPGRLCQALGIARVDDGLDLLAEESPVRLGEGRPRPGETLASGARVGISPALSSAGRPWRWWLAGNPHVSTARSARPLPGGRWP